MSKRGYIATHVIPGSFDSFAFFDFIVEDVVCQSCVYQIIHYIIKSLRSLK